MKQISSHSLRGWNLVTLESELLRVVVSPELGGGIISVRWRPTDTEILFQTRWGLRHRGTASQPGTSEASITEWHPGGWQTLFPNGGDSVVEHGVDWGFHGETWVTAFDWRYESESLVMDADLVRSPFHLTKTIDLNSATLRVTEEITNVGREAVQTMWGQHPVFGAPLLSGDSEIATNARTVRVDGAPGRTAWPYADIAGERVDLRIPPGRGSGESRLIYLSDFAQEASLSVANGALDLKAELRWDAASFPHAWYWLEAGGRQGFPWYGAAYCLGLEPNSSWPAHGLHKARRTGTAVEFAPAETRVAATTLTLGPLSTDNHVSRRS